MKPPKLHLRRKFRNKCLCTLLKWARAVYCHECVSCEMLGWAWLWIHTFSTKNLFTAYHFGHNIGYYYAFIKLIWQLKRCKMQLSFCFVSWYMLCVNVCEYCTGFNSQIVLNILKQIGLSLFIYFLWNLKRKLVCSAKIASKLDNLLRKHEAKW